MVVDKEGDGVVFENPLESRGRREVARAPLSVVIVVVAVAVVVMASGAGIAEGRSYHWQVPSGESMQSSNNEPNLEILQAVLRNSIPASWTKYNYQIMGCESKETFHSLGGPPLDLSILSNDQQIAGFIPGCFNGRHPRDWWS